MPETYSGEAVAAGLPSAQDLITVARAAINDAHSDPVKAASKALDRWKPAVDQFTDQAGAARFLGYGGGAGTVRRKRFRKLADGTPEWPQPNKVFGRSPVWTYRRIVLHLAQAPGRGHPGYTGGRDWDRGSLPARPARLPQPEPASRPKARLRAGAQGQVGGRDHPVSEPVAEPSRSALASREWGSLRR